MLKTLGYTIFGAAENGQIAIELYKSSIQKPEIIIMDHRMPIKDGIETTLEILAIEPKAKIIFTTADDSIKDVALKNGAFCVIKKPFEFDDLIASIKKALNKIK